MQGTATTTDTLGTGTSTIACMAGVAVAAATTTSRKSSGTTRPRMSVSRRPSTTTTITVAAGATTSPPPCWWWGAGTPGLNRAPVCCSSTLTRPSFTRRSQKGWTTCTSLEELWRTWECPLMTRMTMTTNAFTATIRDCLGHASHDPSFQSGCRLLLRWWCCLDPCFALHIVHALFNLCCSFPFILITYLRHPSQVFLVHCLSSIL